MNHSLLLVLAGAVLAAFVNLVWETLDYGFPDDLMRPTSNKTAVVGAQSSQIIWFAHLTDLHISKFYAPERNSQLRQLVHELVKYVKPVSIVVTGDLTDAKTKDMSGSGQYVEEWEEYQSIIRSSSGSGSNFPIWLDIRGNHDNFDIPSPNHRNNYFRTHSYQGRKGNLGSYLENVRSNGVNLGFLAVDATLKPGPRRPFNFVGALNQAQLDYLSGLANKSAKEHDATIFFGHYPTSTILSHSPGIKDVMRNGLVYLCGHLHNLHGIVSTMFVRHKNGLREAELTDWKDNRYFRIMAIDHGVMSWKDVQFSPRDTWPVTLVTWPPGADTRAGDREPLYLVETSTHIRLLVFSQIQIMSVKLNIDDGDLVTCDRSNLYSLWTAPWSHGLYSRGIHVIKVQVEDEFGEMHVTRHVFSVDGKTRNSEFPNIGQLILSLDMVAIFQFLFSLLVLISVGSLSLARMKSQLPDFLQRFLRPLAQRNHFYYPLVGAPLYLTIGPWFVGHVLSDSIGVVFCWGTLMSFSYIPTATTWLYGVYHMVTTHIPLTLLLAWMLNIRTRSGCGNNVITADYHYQGSSATLVTAHGLMLVLIIKQAWLVFAFYQAYGLMAVILGPFRTGYLLMSLYLWMKASYVNK